LAAQALRLFLSGATAAGHQHYAQALRAKGGHDLPVAFHASVLRAAGRLTDADLLPTLAYAAGGDPCAVPLLQNTPPAAVVAEYDRWFVRGCATPAMVAHALCWLSRAGASSDLANLVAEPALLAVERLAIGRDALEAVAALLSRGEHLPRSPAVRSARDLGRIPDLHLSAAPAIITVHTQVAERVQRYLDRVRTLGHVMSAHLPQRPVLRSWANISDGRGYHTPHIHTGCWVVAVLFVQGPSQADDTEAGCLRIGHAPGGNAHCHGWPTAQIAPEAGTLVLMPSFYTHWTVPHPSCETRITIAFNVCEADAPLDDQE